MVPTKLFNCGFLMVKKGMLCSKFCELNYLGGPGKSRKFIIHLDSGIPTTGGPQITLFFGAQGAVLSGVLC